MTITTDFPRSDSSTDGAKPREANPAAHLRRHSRSLHLVAGIRDGLANTQDAGFWESFEMSGTYKRTGRPFVMSIGRADVFSTPRRQLLPPDVMDISVFKASRRAFLDLLAGSANFERKGKRASSEADVTTVQYIFTQRDLRGAVLTDTYLATDDRAVLTGTTLSLQTIGHNGRPGQMVNFATGSSVDAIRLVAQGFKFRVVVEDPRVHPVYKEAIWETSEKVEARVPLTDQAQSRMWVAAGPADPTFPNGAKIMRPTTPGTFVSTIDLSDLDV